MFANVSSLSQAGKDQIKEICDWRKISHLVHFTQLPNLSSILAKGLIPRSDLEQDDAIFNDMYRYDGYLESVSLSIQFPNYSMFFSYRSNDPDWVVLILDKSILWKLDCAFFHENAATNTLRNKPLAQFKSVGAFESMFEDVNYKGVRIHRSELGIPDCFTTNPQAEVLVFSEIEPNLIKSVFCSTRNVEREVKRIAGLNNVRSLSIHCDGRPFEPRKDYEIWTTIRKAKDEDAESQRKLGNYYLKGKYVEEDEEEAVKWFKAATMNEDAAGINQLAYCYTVGKGISKNKQKAFELFQKSASFGLKVAQFNLGVFYEKGLVGEKDLQKAREWYSKSAAQGYEKAKEKLVELQNEDLTS